MNSHLLNLREEILRIYQSNPKRAERLVEDYLDETLKDYPLSEKISLLEDLLRQFELPPSQEVRKEIPFDSKEFSRLFSLIFGERIAEIDFSSPQLLEKLAQSLNTIFDSLNEIIQVINQALFGKKPELETIRHIIGSQLEGDEGRDSLQSYLSRIKEAFLLAHKAFQEAAHIKMVEILKELHPDTIESEGIKGLRFGPFRKAELFERYREKFQSLKKWFDSGRFDEELLREFEKICQRRYPLDRR
jgi:hypothetical protein